MACNETQKNCQPCKDCPPITPPVLPRCDIALPDGVFAQATVYVDNGCITRVEAGEPYVYSPEANCGPPAGGGGGGGGVVGGEGPPGPAATVTVGSVTQVGSDQPLRITNVGDSHNAILNFEIPRAEAGGGGGGGHEKEGYTGREGGINIEDGRIIDVPVTWPPVMFIMDAIGDSGIQLTFVKDPNNGVVTTALDATELINRLNREIQNLENRLDDALSNLQMPFMNKWRDATSQHSIGTTYTNNKPYAIQVQLRMTYVGQQSAEAVLPTSRILVDGIPRAIGQRPERPNDGPLSGNPMLIITATVPPGSTYVFVDAYQFETGTPSFYLLD